VQGVTELTIKARIVLKTNEIWEIEELSLGTQKRPLAGGSNAASGRWLNDSSFGLSRQGFLYLLAA
jgi:hypothetical protein